MSGPRVPIPVSHTPASDAPCDCLFCALNTKERVLPAPCASIASNLMGSLALCPQNYDRLSAELKRRCTERDERPKGAPLVRVSDDTLQYVMQTVVERIATILCGTFADHDDAMTVGRAVLERIQRPGAFLRRVEGSDDWESTALGDLVCGMAGVQNLVAQNTLMLMMANPALLQCLNAAADVAMQNALGYGWADELMDEVRPTLRHPSAGLGAI